MELEVVEKADYLTLQVQLELQTLVVEEEVAVITPLVEQVVQE